MHDYRWHDRNCGPLCHIEACQARVPHDQALRTNDRIPASAGSLTDSIILAMPDDLRIAAPGLLRHFRRLPEIPKE